MAIQDEMYKMIEKEINQMASDDKLQKLDPEKVKQVAKMLTSLSTEKAEAEQLVSQYIANIKNICK
ncbi:Uncharacterised protein [Candidatus Ornithobacterium hominis]|uniref:Uncharacterized protein n=1 Tax=Candidatus Ornithobacterium hominis TaxID=2497989 RepID=A0A383U4P8_9FLAO|nr:hypothetical protein [Candidatus Ornithobacterium hominis]MCT7904719.1 hypothetical protein [Candidatus Ornithobacterium hominis]SZD73933.1 Uncharacterised protein [Candidatus Ornithobacterium hominis]